MTRIARRIVSAVTLAASLALVSAPAQAVSSSKSGTSSTGIGQYEHDSDTMPALLDMMVVRPVGLGMLAVGTALMLPVGLFTLCTRPTEIQQPFDALMAKPAEFVFLDPIGAH